MWEHCSVMTATVEKIAEEVQGLREQELDEFLSWPADYELAHPDRWWDREIERDSQPGGRLDAVLQRVRSDIAAGRTELLDGDWNCPFGSSSVRTRCRTLWRISRLHVAFLCVLL